MCAIFVVVGIPIGIDGANWKNPEHDYWTPLMIAAYNNNDGSCVVVLCMFLFDRWCALTVIISFFVVLVPIPIPTGAVELLLDAGGNYDPALWNATNCFGETTMHVIAHSPHSSHGSDKSKKIANLLARHAHIFAGSEEDSLAMLHSKISSRLTYPHKDCLTIRGRKKFASMPFAEYKYGRKFTDWKETRGHVTNEDGSTRPHEDTDYVHTQEVNKESCCGFHIPFCARLFSFIDYPMALFWGFFERSWVNGGYTVEQYTQKYDSHIVDSLKAEIKKHHRDD